MKDGRIHHRRLEVEDAEPGRLANVVGDPFVARFSPTWPAPRVAEDAPVCQKEPLVVGTV